MINFLSPYFWWTKRVNNLNLKKKSLFYSFNLAFWCYGFIMFSTFCVLFLGGLAAYNAGIDHVDSWNNVDQHTTHHDYSNDVIARAQYLVSHYSWWHLYRMHSTLKKHWYFFKKTMLSYSKHLFNEKRCHNLSFN